MLGIIRVSVAHEKVVEPSAVVINKLKHNIEDKSDKKTRILTFESVVKKIITL